MVLTNTAIRQAKSHANNYTLSDFDGLALFVSTKGTKSWHFRFSWAGKQPRISLGTFPEIGLRDARALRDMARALVAKGIPAISDALSAMPNCWTCKAPPERFSVDVLQILGPCERGAAPPEDFAVVRWGSSNAGSGYANSFGPPPLGSREGARNTSEF